MIITSYRFGELEIAGHVYRADVIITPERIVDSWRRAEGHSLMPADLADAFAAEPEVLVVGTGYFGRMGVPAETRGALEARGIEVHQARTPQAVLEFNRLQRESRRVVAAVHLTC